MALRQFAMITDQRAQCVAETSALPTTQKPIAQHVVEFADLMDFLSSPSRVVLDSVIAEQIRFGIENDKTTARVFIPWLADAADVKHRLFASIDRILVIDLVWR